MHGHSRLLAGLVGEEKVVVFAAKLVETPRDFHIHLAVPPDFFHAAFLPPFKGLHSVRALRRVQGGPAEIVEGDPVAQEAAYLLKHVEPLQSAQSVGRERLQDGVVEAEAVEPDDKPCFAENAEEFPELILPETPVF